MSMLKRGPKPGRPQKKTARVVIALQLLDQKNPDSPEGYNYTVFQAAKKAGCTDSALYYHMKKHREAETSTQHEDKIDLDQLEALAKASATGDDFQASDAMHRMLQGAYVLKLIALARKDHEPAVKAGELPPNLAKRLMDALNAMLWLYRRLPGTYGRPPFVDAALLDIARIVDIDAPAVIKERAALLGDGKEASHV